MSAAVRRNDPQPDAPRAQLDLLLVKLLADEKVKAITLAAMMAAGEKAGGTIHGAVRVLVETNARALRGLTEGDVLRLADDLLRLRIKEERERVEDTRPTARKFRAMVVDHLNTLKFAVERLREEREEAKKEAAAAAKRVSEYDQPAHRQVFREKTENVTMVDVKIAAAESALSEYGARLKAEKSDFEELVRLAVAGSSGSFERRTAPKLARAELIMTELAQIGLDLLDEVRDMQRCTALARDLAGKLGVPSYVFQNHRTIDSSDVRAYLSRSAARGLRALKQSPRTFEDLIDLRTHWA